MTTLAFSILRNERKLPNSYVRTYVVQSQRYLHELSKYVDIGKEVPVRPHNQQLDYVCSLNVRCTKPRLTAG
jgi:hypothetical protein